MPSFEHVTYNSSRVQRAFRINNIEELKLKGKLHLLDKERIHRQRITNQDIRLISLTLDYIQSSSGHSTEALAADSDDNEERKQDGPCFLYGERIISRRKRRNIRPQTAFDQSGNFRTGDSTSIASSTNDAARPQSSPVRKRPTFITSLRDDISEAGTLSGQSKSGAACTSPQPAWEDEPSDITKILLRAKENESKQTRRESIFKRDKNVSAFKALTRNLRISSTLLSQSQSSTDPKVSRPSLGHISPVSGKRASLHDILTQSRPTLSASAWKSQLNRNQTGSFTSTLQRQFIMNSKKELNKSKSAVIQGRIKEFIKS